MTWTVDPLLQEYVNEKLFESIVKTKIATDRVVPETAELTKDEHNALRYVAGFVPFKLKKKFTKSSHPEFLLCLSQMNKDKGGDDDDDDTFEKYTSLVDRGGLFNVRLVLQQGSLTKEDIIDEIIDDLETMALLNYFSCLVMAQHSRLLSSKFICKAV